MQMAFYLTITQIIGNSLRRVARMFNFSKHSQPSIPIESIKEVSYNDNKRYVTKGEIEKAGKREINIIGSPLSKKYDYAWNKDLKIVLITCFLALNMQVCIAPLIQGQLKLQILSICISEGSIFLIAVPRILKRL
jgi:hypothetical protein